MAIATGTALAIGAGVAAAGSVGSAVIGANAASKASKAQTNAANYAADLQKQEADDSLNFQKQVYSDQKTALQPYQAAGTAALGQLTAGTATGGQFEQGFTADNMAELDPGFDFRMNEGMKALTRAEAAGGNVGGGGALKAAESYGEDYASNEFNNAYNRFMTTRQSNFNNLAALAGVGQSATNSANAAGTSAAGNIANINSTYATNAGQDLMAAGNATASGYMGAANAWGSGLNGVGNSAMDMATIYNLFGKKNP